MSFFNNSQKSSNGKGKGKGKDNLNNNSSNDNINHNENEYPTNEQTPLLLNNNPNQPNSLNPSNAETGDIESAFRNTSPSPHPSNSKYHTQQKNQYCRKAVKIILILLVTIIAIVALSPFIAQRVVDRALDLDIQSASIHDVDQSGFQISLLSTLHLDSSKDGLLGVTKLVQKLFNPYVTIDATTLSMSTPSSDSDINMAEFEIEKQEMRMSETLQLNISTHVRVTNPKLMAEFFSKTLDQSTVTMALRGPIYTKLGSLWYMKLRLSRSIPLDGLRGIQNASLVSMELPNDHPLGGVIMKGVARIDNPSKVFSINLGAVTFGIFLPSLAHPDIDFYQVAEVESPELRLEAGKSTELSILGRLFHLDDWNIIDIRETFNAAGSEKQLILGQLLSQFIEGKDSTIQIRALSKDVNIPPWLSQVFKSIVLKIVFPGSATSDFIKAFDMNNLQFGFSNSENSALISGELSSVLQLPPNVTFPIKVLKMKPITWLKPPGGSKMAHLQVPEFISTVSKQVGTTLQVQVALKDVPVVIEENQDTEFYKFLNSSFHMDWIRLGITGDAIAVVECGLGTFEIGPIGFDVVTTQRGIGGLTSTTPILEGLDVVDSTEHSLTIKATLVVWNPSNITANLGTLSFLWSYNDYVIGMASVPDTNLQIGNNTIECFGMMDPTLDCTRKGDPGCDPEFARNASREFISKYISGDNSTTIDILGYENTSNIPLLRRVLSAFSITSHLPVIEDDFLVSSTMYLLSHTIVLELQNPLDTLITVLYINGTASYKGDPLGHVLVDFEHDIASPKPIIIPANDHQNETSGYTKTPRLPVTFDLSSVGYEALKKALGGTLEMDVLCHIKAKVGSMLMWIDFSRDGVSSNVRKGF